MWLYPSLICIQWQLNLNRSDKHEHTNRQRQYKGNNSISFQICPLIGVTKNKYNTEYIQYVLFIGIFRQHIMGYILL
jgi:hypothetical protein